MSFIRTQFDRPLGYYQRVAEPLPILGFTNADVDGSLEIAKLVTANERNQKITALFESQLLLPIERRNVALMKRFGITTGNNGTIDGWPSSNDKRIRFLINAEFPVDKTIPDTSRLNTKCSVLGIFEEVYTGNSLYFYFPMSKHGVAERDQYKLDGLDTWVYASGLPVRDRGSYTLYRALYDYLHSQNAEEYITYFQKHGMISAERGILLQPRGLGFTVSSYIKNAGNAAKEIMYGAASNAPELVANAITPEKLAASIPPADANTLTPGTKLNELVDPEVEKPDPFAKAAAAETPAETPAAETPAASPVEPVEPVEPVAPPVEPTVDVDLTTAALLDTLREMFPGIKITEQVQSNIPNGFQAIRPTYILRRLDEGTATVQVIHRVHHRHTSRNVDKHTESYMKINKAMLKRGKYIAASYEPKPLGLTKEILEPVNQRLSGYNFTKG